MAWNGDMSRNFFGGVPIIIYNSETLYLGDMARTFYGSIPSPVSVAFSGPVKEEETPTSVATFTDVTDGENPTIKIDIAEAFTLTDSVDGDTPFKVESQETVSFTDAIDGTGFVDRIAETATITDTQGRSIETSLDAGTGIAILADAMNSVVLAEGLAESAIFDDRMFGAPGNVIRRKAMFWDIQANHLQIKYSHNQLDKCTQAEDVSIRTNSIRRQDSIRWVHQGRHLGLKFQHHELGKTKLLELLAIQVNRVSNLYTVKWQDTGMLCHQGNHLAVKIQHNDYNTPMLMESLSLRVNQINNP